MAAHGRWKHAAQVAQQLRGIPDRIGREENGIQRAGLEPLAQGGGGYGAMQAEEAADAGEGKAQPDGNGREPFGGNQN